MYESAESGTVGSPFSSSGWQNVEDTWLVTGDDAYEGNKALTADNRRTAWLILPVSGFDDNFVFSLVARSKDDHHGNGTLQILSSAHGDRLDDFIQVAAITTNEEWKQFSYPFSAETKYIVIRQHADAIPSMIDAISLNENAIDAIYGYDIYRDGEKVNDEAVSGAR